MPIYLYQWYDDNIEHVEEHGVSTDEFEAVVNHPIGKDESHSSDRIIAFGYGDDGRKLACLYEMLDEITVLPVTAYEVE
jgi:uncharacterized DUF497 family protein